MEYATHMGLTLLLVKDASGCRVTLTGDREKLLFEGKDEVAARRVFDEAKKHYEERKKVENGGG